MSSIAKAKTAKLSKYTCRRLLRTVRTLIDYYPPSAREAQMSITQDNIEWAREEKRVFLRQSLEIKLVGLSVVNR